MLTSNAFTFLPHTDPSIFNKYMNTCTVLLIVVVCMTSQYVVETQVAVAQNIVDTFGVTTPMYVSTNGTVTSTRVIDVSTIYPKTEVSFTEAGVIYLVGNVSNTGTYIETIESSNVTKG